MHDIEHTRLIERKMISIPNVSIDHCKTGIEPASRPFSKRKCASFNHFGFQNVINN